MQLTDNDISLAENENYEWKINNFIISVRVFAHHKSGARWKTLLFARPENTNDPGWSNIPFKCDSKDWDYILDGTGTIIVPKKHIQELIKMSLTSFKVYS